MIEKLRRGATSVYEDRDCTQTLTFTPEMAIIIKQGCALRVRWLMIMYTAVCRSIFVDSR